MIKRLWRIIRWLVAVAIVITAWAAFFDAPTNILMYPLTIHEDVQPSDVIIVLGSGTKNKTADHLPMQAKDRIVKGMALWKSGQAPAIIMTGGLDKKTNMVEADQMVAYAEQAGAAPSILIPERQARDTSENAKYSLQIMDAHHWGSALVVTSPYHTRRACAIFRKLGASVQCIIAPFYSTAKATPLDRLGNFRSVLREYGAWGWNWVRGNI